MEVCRICGKECENKKGFSYHLTTNHNIDFINYLEEYDENFKRPVCVTCGKEIKYEDVQNKIGSKRVVSYQEYMKNRFCSDECKIVTGDTRRMLSEAGKKGGKATLGRKASEETKKKMSESTKRYWDNLKK